MRIFKRAGCLRLGAGAAVVLGLFMLSVPVSAREAVRAQGETGATGLRYSHTSQIASFIKRVWRESPLMLEADARLKAVRNQVKADSKWLYNPELELTVEDNEGAARTRLLGVSQTIDWNGKARASGRVAGYELQAAIAERDDVRQGIAAELLSALADYQAAKEVLILSSERTRLMERFASLETSRFKAGDIDQSGYNLAQLALSEALMQHAEAEATLSEMRLALESAIGYSGDSAMALPVLPPRLPKLSMNGKGVDTVVAALPSIRMLQSSAKALRASVTRARRERIADPTLSVTGGKDTGANLVGVSLSIPINIFNTYGAEVEVARFKSSAQEKSLQSALYIARSRIESSKKTYELSSRAWKVWMKRGSRALEQQVEILDKKFKVGELSATEYLVQIQQTLDTRIAAEELHSRAWKAWFAWIRVSGSVEQWLQGE